MDHRGGGTTTFGGGTAISNTGGGMAFQPVPAEFNHWLHARMQDARFWQEWHKQHVLQCYTKPQCTSHNTDNDAILLTTTTRNTKKKAAQVRQYELANITQTDHQHVEEITSNS